MHAWNFTVLERPRFSVQGYTRELDETQEPGTAGTAITNVAARVKAPFPVAEAFTFAPVHVSVAHADPSKITFSLDGNATKHGLFINPATGAVQGVVNRVGQYQVILLARDEYGAQDEVENVMVDFRERDISNATNGPNNKGCIPGHGLTTDTSGSEFDGRYACTCNTGFSGANCETSASEVADGAVVTTAILLPIIIFLCAIAAIAKYQAYQKARAPADFPAHLQLLLDAGELKQEEFDATQPPREIPRAWLTMVDRLGKGNFGEVWKGSFNDRSNTTVPEYLVAAKTVLSDSTSGPLSRSALDVQEGHDDLVQVYMCELISLSLT